MDREDSTPENGSQVTQQFLEQILESKSFDQLDAISELARAQPLNQKEKELLAEMFVMQAETLLREEAASVQYGTIKKSLEKAYQLGHHLPQLWHRKGRVFLEFDTEDALTLACLAFDMAISIDASFVEAYISWSEALVRKSLLTKDDQFLPEAREKTLLAEDIIKVSPESYSNELRQRLYWRAGIERFVAYRFSGEPHDVSEAIAFYKKVDELGSYHGEFYNDYGTALVEFSALVGRLDLILDAIDLYIKAVAPENKTSVDPEELGIRYYNLGSCYQYLFEEHFIDAHFTQARDCLLRASELSPQFLPARSRLGGLLLFAGKLWNDSFVIEESVKVLMKAYEIEQSQQIALFYAEALIYHGKNTENINFISQARSIIKALQEIEPNAKEPSVYEALALIELAKYFQDAKYCQEAIDLLEGITGEKKDPFATYVTARAKTILGMLTDDPDPIQEALLLYFRCSKADFGRYSFFWNEWGLALLAIAELVQNVKHIEEASEKFGRAILLQDVVHPEWLLNYGSVLDLMGDLTEDENCYERAIQVLSASLALDPTSSDTHLQLGFACLHYGEVTYDEECFRKALEHFQWLVSEDPEDDVAWHEVGLINLHLSECVRSTHDAREEYLRRAEEALKRSLALGGPFAFYTLACLYSLMQNEPEALLNFEKAISLRVTPPYEEILKDEWLAYIKNSEQFQYLLRQIRND